MFEHHPRSVEVGTTGDTFSHYQESYKLKNVLNFEQRMVSFVRKKFLVNFCGLFCSKVIAATSSAVAILHRDFITAGY